MDYQGKHGERLGSGGDHLRRRGCAVAGHQRNGICRVGKNQVAAHEGMEQVASYCEAIFIVHFQIFYKTRFS